MEIGLAVLSLLWVIGILNLQRIDSIIIEFTRSLASYLSVSQTGETQGMVNLEQFNLLISKSKQELILLLKHNIANSKRKDIGGLKKALKFYYIAEKLKTAFEILLLSITVAIPLMEILNFKGFPYTQMVTKESVLIVVLAIFVIITFTIHKVVQIVSNKYYPITFKTSK